MLYKPSEIADELGLNTDTIYKSYIPAGCPHRRGQSGAIWIVGTEFADWAQRTFIKRKVPTYMGHDQAWCFRCRQPVDVLEMTVRNMTSNAELVSGTCARCGARVSRGRKSNNDQP